MVQSRDTSKDTGFHRVGEEFLELTFHYQLSLKYSATKTNLINISIFVDLALFFKKIASI